MEAIAVLIGIGALCFYLVAPILALGSARAAKSDSDWLRKRMESLEEELQRLRGEVLSLRRAERELREGLGQVHTAQQTTAAYAPISAPPQPAAPSAPPPDPAGPLPEFIWRAPPPITSPSAPTNVDPPIAAPLPPPGADPAPPLTTPHPPLAVPPAPAQSSAPSDAGAPIIPPRIVNRGAEAALAIGIHPYSPPQPAAAVPDLRPTFDWEKLLGVRGAAALGGIALVIAGALFAKYSIENNLIPPAVRIAILIATAVCCLVGAEVVLRRGYAATANATAGAGVALLYSAFYAAHGIYQLLSLSATFAMMALTTVVACLLSLRHNASFIAILGLLGGFATPLLLSTGQDRPVGLFSYILLLDIGVLYIALHRGWSRLVHISLVFTLLLQVGWANKFLSPAKLPLALGIFTVFALLYLIIPTLARGAQRQELKPNALIGGFFPFAFVLLLAGDRDYAARWPLLAGYDAALSVALMIISLRSGQPTLLLGGALATAGTLLLWAGHQLNPASCQAASATAVGLTLLYHLPASLRLRAPGLWARLSPNPTAPTSASGSLAAEASPTALSPWTLEACALLLAGALYFYALSLVQRGLGHPPAVFLGLLTTLFLLGLERTAAAATPFVSAVFPAALALLAQAWFFQGTNDARVLQDLAVPVLLAVGYSLQATRLARPPTSAAAAADVGALIAAGAGLFGLFACIDQSNLTKAPLPLFLVLSAHLLLILLAPFRNDRTWLWPAGLLVAAGFCQVWQQSAFQRVDIAVVTPFYCSLYLVFLLVPLLFPVRLRPAWLLRRAPLLASGLAGPLFFFPIHKLWRATLGSGAQGALPVLLGALSMLALALLRRRFAESEPAGVGHESPLDAAAFARARLRGLALLAAVAVGFISVAIPMQLEREWITIGWALEAGAVWWLYRRLPHAGLRYLGLALYVTVAVRLLLNPEVLRYHPRGLPVFNWILYTYGVPALCFLLGAFALASVEPADPNERPRLERALFPPWLRLPTLSRGLALLLLFWLINLEIADYFSPGRYVEIYAERGAARDLATSVSWGLYALLLLGIGMWRRSRVLRFVSLGFMLLTITKVFLYDLSSLKGLYQVLSFLGLALSLIMVSLLYQRFVFRAPAPGAGEERS